MRCILIPMLFLLGCSPTKAQETQSSPAQRQETHNCSVDAAAKAEKLIRLHFGEDNRIEIFEDIEILSPLTNPENESQIFDVLELWGHINNGRYRMRFIYARMDHCVLMGQEILEYASL